MAINSAGEFTLEPLQVPEDFKVGEKESVTLLPCPFCGGEAHIFTHEDDKTNKPLWVSCNDCEADGPHYQVCDDPIAGWNHRAPVKGTE
jgi:Lar family restriction alleviation protein